MYTNSMYTYQYVSKGCMIYTDQFIVLIRLSVSLLSVNNIINLRPLIMLIIELCCISNTTQLHTYTQVKTYNDVW